MGPNRFEDGLRISTFQTIKMQPTIARNVRYLLLPIYDEILRRLIGAHLGLIIEVLPIMTVKVSLRRIRTIDDCVHGNWNLVLTYSRDIVVACTTLSKVRLVSFLGSIIVAVQSRVCIEVITRHLSCALHLVRMALVGVHVIH